MGLTNTHTMSKKEEKTVLKGQLTPEEIALLKAKHIYVYEQEIDGRVAYLKRPDRSTLSAAEKVGERDSNTYNQIIVENCWLGGCEELKEDAIYCAILAGCIMQLFQVKVGELKNL